MTSPKRLIGQRVRRVEDARLLRGEGRFAGDHAPEGVVHAVVLRSPHAHARIRAIDTSRAKALLVLTAADIAELGTLPGDPRRQRADASPAFQTPRALLARDRVRFVGDPVAFVVASTRAEALDGAEAIEVDYEPLGIDRPVWDQVPDNIAYVWRHGDGARVDDNLARSAHVVSLDIDISRVTAAPIEPRGAVATYRDGVYELVTGDQHPHVLAASLAAILDVPKDSLRVIVRDVGGSFGMKGGVYPEPPLALVAAKRLGRPVKWISDRAEAFLSDDGARDVKARASLGLDGDGRITAIKVDATVDIGAYLSPRSSSFTNNVGGIVGVYRVPAAAATITGRYGFANPVGPYRGAGRPEATSIIERLMDDAARRLRLDPIELRRRNLVDAAAMPYDTGFIFRYDSGDFAATLKRALSLAAHDRLAERRAAAAARGRLHGFGLAMAIEVAAGPFGMARPDHAELELTRDGSLSVRSGTTAMGQGNATAFTQIAADTLGLDMAAIGVLLGDTERLSDGRGNGGSSAMSVGGSTVLTGARAVLARARAAAASQLGVAAEALRFEDGRFVVPGTNHALTLGDVAAQAGPIIERISYKAEAANFPNGCHACEIEIDPETGTIEIVRYVAVEDIGTVINPMLVEGQMHGGIVQGLGQVLMERIVRDAHSGQVLTGSFMDYALPRAGDLPRFELDERPVATATNALGAKGVGEAGTVGALAAAMNAINDALAARGVGPIEMPASPERVWRALQGLPPA